MTVARMGMGEAGVGEAGTDEAGMGEAGMGEAGMDEAGMDEAGTDEAGMGEAGTDEAGMGEAGTDEADTDETGRRAAAPVLAVDRIDRIRRGDEAWSLARRTYDALLAVLDDLAPEDWERPTVCAPWTVADMVRHLVGAARAHASVREMIRQQAWAARRKGAYGGSALDAWTALHVMEHADLAPDELVAALRAAAPQAIRGRARLPALLGRLPVPLDQAGSLPEGSPRRITLGDLNTVVYTRDAWLHRIDISRATGRALRLDPDVDGRIIEDVVVEWAERHGSPFVLTLGGAAGGRYARGDGGPEITLDAVEFAWILSGRGEPADGTAGADLLATRVVF